MSDLTPQSETPTPTTDKITQAARETIYLCNFRVSVDGEWLCLRELNDISLTPDPEPAHEGKPRPRLATELCDVSKGVVAEMLRISHQDLGSHLRWELCHRGFHHVPESCTAG